LIDGDLCIFSALPLRSLRLCGDLETVCEYTQITAETQRTQRKRKETDQMKESENDRSTI